MSVENPEIDCEEDEAPAKKSARDMSWVQTVESFEEEAHWLTPVDFPQLKALYAIAEQLDGGDLQAAKVSQFTLVQRTLASKRPDDGNAPPRTEADQVLEMFEQNPGAVWRA